MIEQIHVWHVGSGVVVELRCTRPLTVRDFEMLSRYVNLAQECATIDAEPSREDGEPGREDGGEAEL